MTSLRARAGLIVAALVLSACTGTPAPAATPRAPTSTTPRGEQIVFFDDPLGTGHQQLYIESADGSNVRRLVTSNANDVNPSLSPDGSVVAFTRQVDPNPEQTFVVNADGSGLHQLHPGGCPSRCSNAVEGGAWSPDGSMIAFTRAIFGAPGNVPTSVELWIMNADGTGARRLTSEHTSMPGGAQDDGAGWSPDGTRVVFLHLVYGPPDRYGIFTITVDGTGLQRVTPADVNAAGPAWSPDGARIAFQTPPDPTTGVVQRIYTIRPNGTGLTLLTAGLGGNASNHPSWSPDGSRLVFSHAPSGPNGSDLFVMNRDGSGLHVLAVTPLNENGPCWGK